MLFKENDKKRFKKGKFLTSRDSNCKFKTGKMHKLCFGMKKAEAEAFFKDSFLYDLNCLTDKMAIFLGYENKEEYLKEEFNRGKTIKKIYVMDDITFYDDF